jgi:hypothetical protein
VGYRANNLPYLTPTYIRLAKGTSAVLIATDAFGSGFVNMRLLADSITKHTGFLCVVPELFDHDALSPDLFEGSFSQEERMKVRL